MNTTKTLQSMQPSYIREILKAANSDGVISFAGGLPNPESFPMPLIAQSLEKVASKADLFQYGSTDGYRPLLEYCHAKYTLKESHQALISNGSQQGLDLIARAYISPGDKVLVESPSYLGALQVFNLAQADIRSVSSTTKGPELSELEIIFSQQDIKIFYVIPDFQNPTGICWSLESRQQVAKLCQQYNATLLEDVPYRELRFSGKNLPLVSSFCPDHSLVLRSFSKFIAPGMRLGLVTAKKTWIQALIKVKQAADLHTNTPMQALLLDVLTHPDFALHKQNLVARYAQAYQNMANMIDKKLSQHVTFEGVEGGMFIWLSLPPCDDIGLAKEALNRGVAVVPSSVFYHSNHGQPSALRLNFSHSSEADIERGLERLEQVIRRFC